jgi:hypothetical protein
MKKKKVAPGNYHHPQLHKIIFKKKFFGNLCIKRNWNF